MYAVENKHNCFFSSNFTPTQTHASALSQKYLQVYVVFNTERKPLPTFQPYNGAVLAIAGNSPLLKSRNLCAANTVVMYKMVTGFLVNSNGNEMISAANLVTSQGTISVHLIVKTKISVQCIIRVAFNRHYFGLNLPVALEYIANTAAFLKGEP
jgi:hypothetical protein